jgi:hypothetical protein
MSFPGRLPDNCAYFRRRESQERTLAADAADCAARYAHLAMADQYAALIREDRTLIIKPVVA